MNPFANRDGRYAPDWTPVQDHGPYVAHVLRQVAIDKAAEQVAHAIRHEVKHRDDGQCHPACWDRAVAEFEAGRG